MKTCPENPNFIKIGLKYQALCDPSALYCCRRHRSLFEWYRIELL